MKRWILFSLLFVGFISLAQIVDIPDANFKNALVNFSVADIGNGTYEDVDTNNDGEIQLSEAEAVIDLMVVGLSIASMQGIESFVNIERLICANNSLNSIDVNQLVMLNELDVGQNNLTILDVSNNTGIEILRFNNTQVASIDLSENTSLLILQAGTTGLTDINVTNNIEIEFLGVSGNQLTSLDVSSNVHLIDLNCQNNNI